MARDSLLARRQTEAARLRAAGLSYREIAASDDVPGGKRPSLYGSHEGARKAVQAAQRAEQAYALDTPLDERTTTLARYDRLIRAMTPAAEIGDTKAATVILRTEAQRARLLGLDHRDGLDARVHAASEAHVDRWHDALMRALGEIGLPDDWQNAVRAAFAAELGAVAQVGGQLTHDPATGDERHPELRREPATVDTDDQDQRRAAASVPADCTCPACVLFRPAVMANPARSITARPGVDWQCTGVGHGPGQVPVLHTVPEDTLVHPDDWTDAIGRLHPLRSEHGGGGGAWHGYVMPWETPEHRAQCEQCRREAEYAAAQTATTVTAPSAPEIGSDGRQDVATGIVRLHGPPAPERRPWSPPEASAAA